MDHSRLMRSKPPGMSVRFCPKVGKRADVLRRPLCATTGLMRCSKQRLYSITSSATASSDGEISRQARSRCCTAVEAVIEVWSPARLEPPKNAKSGVAGDTHLSFSLLALGVADFAPVCPWQLAVQSASAARHSFGTAYGMSLRSGDSRPILHAINP